MNLSTLTLLTLVVLPAYLLRWNVFGIPTTFLEALLLLVIGWGGITLLKGNSRLSGLKIESDSDEQSRVQRNLFVIAIVLILIAATISLFVAPDRLAALGVYKAYFIEPVLFSVIVYCLLHRGNITRDQILTAFNISACLISLIAITQWLVPSTIPIPWDIERRVTSIFEYPNAIGLFLAPIVTIAWLQVCWLPSSQSGYLVARRWKWSSFLSLAVALLGSLAIVLAQSEAAIVAVLTSLFLAFAVRHIQTKVWGPLGVQIVLGILILVAIFFTPSLRDKLTLQDYSGQVRISQWTETWEMLKDRPMLGAGLSGYPEALRPYHTATHYEIFQYPHNVFLNTWSEMGLMGLMGLIGLIAWCIRTTGATQTLTFFALLTILIHGLVDVPFFKNDLAVLTCTLIALFFYDTRKKHS